MTTSSTATPVTNKPNSTSDSHSKYVIAPLLSATRGDQVYTVGFVPLRGAAAPHSTVMIAVDGVDVQSVQASKYGAWASDVEIQGIGKHHLVLRNVDSAGETLSETREYEITLVEQPAELPVTGNSAADGVWLGMVLALALFVWLIWRDRAELRR